MGELTEEILKAHEADSEGYLDDMVHDIKSSEASSINNQGIDEQIDFILGRGDYDLTPKRKRWWYQEMAAAIGARKACHKSGNKEWYERWGERIEELLKMLPTGSGLDSNWFLEGHSPYHDVGDNPEILDPDRLELYSAYHCMDDMGGYTHWINFSVFVLPSLQFGFKLKIKGPFGKRQDVKEYLGDMLTTEIGQEIEGGAICV